MPFDAPAGFRVVAASDYCRAVKDGTHDSPKEVAFGKLLITSRNIKEGRIQKSGAYMVSIEDYEQIIRRSRVDRWDIIFTMIGTVGELALVDEPTPDFAIKNVGLFKTKDEISAKWLYYFLRSPIAREALESRKKGTTQQYISLGDLRSFPVLEPEDPNLKETAVDILSMLDKRIELLRQTNATLESIAQALFKSWFIDFDPVRAKAEAHEPEGMDAATAALFPAEFEESALGLIPKGWQVCELGQICRLEWGNTTITKKSYVDSGFPAFSAAGQDGYVDIAERQGIGSVISAIGTVGVVHLATKQWTAIKNTLTAQCSTDKESAWLHNLLRTVQFPSRGSTQQFISQADARAVKVVAPPKELRIAFGGISEALISGMVIAQDKSKSLSEIRDSLLPRLISGKLRLPEAQAQLEDALA